MTDSFQLFLKGELIELRLFSTANHIMAYCSTSETHWDLGRLSYLKLQTYCENARHPIEILVEKIRPELRSRPRWEELVGRIKANEVKTLVVPHLFHIAGSNVAQLSDFLRLLEEHEVELITLDQRDQKPLSRSQVLIQFVTTQFKFNERP